MAKTKPCNPSPKVRTAGSKLSTSKSPSVKSKAEATLVKHKNTKHK